MLNNKITFDTGCIIHDLVDASYEFVTFETTDELFTHISKILCFGDYDNSIQVCDILVRGYKVRFVGWQPDMHYEYRFVDTNELAWEGYFPNWEH